MHDPFSASLGRLRSSSGQQGFTLVELLVSIAIVALLVALASPTLMSMLARAKQTQSLSNMKSIGTGLITFASDNDHRFPNALVPGAWDVQILPYLDSTKASIFRCPLDCRRFLPGFSPRSYGVTGVTVNLGGWNGGRTERRDGEGISLTQIPKPANFVLLCRISRDWELPMNVVGSVDYSAANGPNPLNPQDPNWSIFGGKTPYAFADGHVTFLTPNQATEVNPNEWTYDK